MRVVIVVISLTIGAAGCATKAPESPPPAPVTTAPNPPQTSKPAKADTAPPSTKDGPAARAPEKPSASAPAKPAVPASPEKPAASAPTKPAATTPAPPSTATTKPATPAPTKPSPPPTAKATAKPGTPPPAAASNPTLDLTALKEQLKSTKAIGIMTKLSLKNQVDDLLDGFREHYAGKGKGTMAQLRQSYDMLMMKVLSLLQDKDQKLASDIVSSREAIWALLANPKTFAALDV